MPGKLKVKILAGRNLPVMDRSGDTTDAYVELKFSNITYKTDVCRKSLNPQWNSEWYKFEVDDAELQDEPLQIRLMDHDTYSANDAIGKVYLNLNPLLLPVCATKNLNNTENNLGNVPAQGSVMMGWIPVYDTMHGIRGEVNLIVKVELFIDFNKFKQSSCGVQFFYSPNIPHGYHAQIIHGFVEELIVTDDPEYKWIDKIRTPRASNEARQTLFFKLSGEVQRKIGLKALDLGGNAVIGYQQNFDLEGEFGIVARGIGTAVTLVKLHDHVLSTDNLFSEEQPEDVAHSARSSPPPLQATPTASKHVRSASVRTGPVVQIHGRSSDSDLSVTTKGSSLTNSDKSTTTNLKPTTPLVKTLTADIKPTSAIIRTMHQEAIEMLEYPFMTMLQYPAGFLLHIGGFVSARSVKLLERVNSLEDPEGRDYWWTEIRMEVRSHARSLGCNVVVGYREEISICDDICVLNASGTAAVINMNNIVLEDSSRANQSLTGTSVDSDRERPRTYSKSEKHEEGQTRTSRARKKSETDREDSFNQPSCSVCHLPYTENGVPFQMTTSKCAICRRAKVADVLFATTEMPENVPVTGRGSFIQATVCKNKKDLRGELNAKEISDLLPFLEYELHSMLYNKLRVKGMNAIFGLKTQVSIGEKLMVAMAVGTAVYITALPEPSVPHIASGNSWHDEEKLIELRRCLAETAMKNREYYQLKSLSLDTDNTKSSDTEDSEEDLPELDVAFGSKDVCVLEVDDVEDMERIHMLIDDRPPDGFHVVNTQTIPGLEELEIVRNLQMFTQVSRTKVPVHPSSIGPLITGPSKYFESVLQTVYFKLRRMIPCALCGLHFKVALPDQDDMQLSVIGMALGLGEPTKLDLVAEKKSITSGKESVKRNDDSEMIFNLEEDPEDSMSDRISNSSNTSSLVATLLHKTRPKSPLRMKTHLFPRPKHMPIKERYGVDITPLSYLPSGRIERYLGNLNFFFIRESTSIREGGGLSGFTHSFMTEILAIVRAHVTALGGNAMVSFFMTQCVLLHSPHENQGQCLINVGGDVVLVSYFGNDRQQIASNC